MFMSRTAAVLIMVSFAVIGVGGAVWGASDIFFVTTEFYQCTPFVEFDTASFLMIGGVSFIALPLFALSASKSFQAKLLVLFVVVFVGGPLGIFAYADRIKDVQGYAVTSGSWSPVASSVVELQTANCTPRPG